MGNPFGVSGPKLTHPFVFNGPGLDELTKEDRSACRRQYKILRIAVYAPQTYTGPTNSCYHGYYGLDREEAKQALFAFYSNLSWLTYLGSK